ncbi:hypothetical protein [Streptomyces griseofuscus]|uniref:hypothetical protein n=1 Tax=Streptomyces griseofuscus TaxID=146922 RepID=UPI00381E1A40
MLDLLLVLSFVLLLSSPIWITWGAGKFSRALSKSKPRESVEVLFIVAVIVLLFVLISGFALFAGV